MSINIILLSGAYEPVQLFLVASLALACVACLAWKLLVSTHKHGAWYEVAAFEKGTSRAGLSAAEKGTSSVAIRAERIPYDLEKRAILHRRWMMIGHESQFAKPGDYRTYTIADIPFLVIRGPDGQLRAFHNVCRHRAYTVARKPCGSSLRLACKYHGWQYDAAGRLVKAPEFAGRPGFRFADNGLFRIHLRVDAGRFVFVNLAAEVSDAFPWTDDDVSSPSLRTLDFRQEGTVEWEVEVQVGWRVATLLPWFLNGARFVRYPWPKKALTYLFQSTQRLPLQYVDDASFICDLGAGNFLLISALPRTAHKSVARCTYLPSPPSSSSSPSSPLTNTKTKAKTDRNDADAVVKIEKLVRAELAAAVGALQRHRMATTDLDFQQSAVRERLDKFSRHVHQHRRLETLAGRKINPALRRSSPSSPSSSSPPPSSSATTATTSDDNNPSKPIGIGEAPDLPPRSSRQQQQDQQQQQRWWRLSHVDVDVDEEAEAICNALDGLGDGASSMCPLERSPELEW